MAENQKKTETWKIPSSPEPVKNVVLVGRTGNGKSATANSIIGKDTFKSQYQAVGVTSACQTFRVPTSPIINVIDTPGLFDLNESIDFISKEIINCLVLAEEGLHAVVLVLSLSGRITQEEENTLTTLQIMFGSKILDYLIILFTCGDKLEDNQMTLDDYLAQGCPEFLKVALRLCGGRRIVFNNMTKDKEKKANQVQELLVHIATIEKETGGNPFTDKMHHKIQEEAERVRKQEREINKKKITEAEKEELRKQLENSYGQNMNMMAQLMEKVLKEAAAANERQMSMMNEFLNISIQEKDERIRRAKEKKEKQRAKKEDEACNIL